MITGTRLEAGGGRSLVGGGTVEAAGGGCQTFGGWVLLLWSLSLNISKGLYVLLLSGALMMSALRRIL